MSSSPIRYRGPWKIQKRTSESDRWLDEMGFFRKHTARDASCLFRAVSEHIYNTQRYYDKVRYDCIQFMASNRNLFEGSINCPFDIYLKEMASSCEWGGLIEISALSHLYRRDFIIFEANKGPQTLICNDYGNPIYLYFAPDTKHFDVVYTKDFITASSFCQSLVYEILYDGVYKLKDVPYAIEKMLHDKLPTSHMEYFMTENVERHKKQKERAKIFIETIDDDMDKNNNAVALKCKHHTEDIERASLLKESLSIFVFNRSLIQLENVCINCLNVNSAKDLLDNGITPFPYKVAKALDPDIYRNIEFDVWSEMRRELRYGARYSDGTTLQVGVKCLCKLDTKQPAPYHCHIQEMRPDGGPCLVFIEELGEKRVVDYEQLEPLPPHEARPWAPSYRYCRTHSQILTLSQMLQQIGNITMKQSRKLKGKSEEKSPDREAHKKPPKITWNELNGMESKELTYQHLDYLNFERVPVEVKALPDMVDCRPVSAAPHEPHPAPNGNTPQPVENQNHHSQLNQQAGAGDMGSHGVTSPGARPSAEASAAAQQVAYAPPYQGPMSVPMSVPYGVNPYCMMGGPVPVPVPVPGMGVGMGGGAGGKGLVWMPPPPAHVPPPPLHVNPHVYKSVQANGADLPLNDMATLRYFFNLGVECMWAACGPPPPRHYSPRDIAQDMQQMSMGERGERGERGGHGADAHKPKPANGDKSSPQINNGKNSQRTLLGPRFNKRGNGQEGNTNPNNGRNNNNQYNGNKGTNNRSYSSRNGSPRTSGSAGPEGEAAPAPDPMMVSYVHYPPPLYPVHYYPVDATDPAMMGGMTYVGYDEGMEYAQYCPGAYMPPPPAALALAPPPPPPPPHQEHK